MGEWIDRERDFIVGRETFGRSSVESGTSGDGGFSRAWEGGARAVRLESGPIGGSSRPSGRSRRRGRVERGPRGGVAGWWPTRRARFDLMTASNTAVTTRSREIAGAPRDAPHAVRRDSTRNRPPIGTRATRDASSRPPPAPLGVAETDARGASQAQRNWQCVLMKPNQLPAKIDDLSTEGGRVTFSEEKLFPHNAARRHVRTGLHPHAHDASCSGRAYGAFARSS